jgi:(p)ppGpp synthase/HD superfamily hydrolase
MHALSSRYDEALVFAAIAHRTQLRKGSDTPYIAHPAHVSILLIRHGFGEDLAIAGLLHDVVEDCDVPIATVRARWGDEVGRLVEAVSEQKHDAGGERSWEERKAEKLAHMRDGDAGVAALKAADALHNAFSVLRDLQDVGPAVWSRFKRGPVPSIAYYREIAAIAREKLGSHPIVDELDSVIAALAQAAQAAPDA